MLRVCVLFYRPRCLQMISLLCLLLLLLSVQTLVAVMEHAKLEQIELGSTIHAAFNELEPIHLPFDRAITPRECQSRKYSIFVLLHTSHKGLKGFEMTGLDGFEPHIKLFSRALTYHVQKRFHQLIGGFQVWACLSQLSEGLQLFCF